MKQDRVYFIRVDAMDAGDSQAFSYKVEDADLLAEIATRVSVTKLKALAFSGQVHLEGNGFRYHLQGTFSASMEQECVQTLEPLQTKLSHEPFEAWFAGETGIVSFEAKKRRKKQDEEASMEGEAGEKALLDEAEAPESLEQGGIDVLEQVVQFLALAINPFPRKGGQDEPFEHREFSKESPFASLANMVNTTKSS